MTLTDEMLRQIMPRCPKARRAQCLPHLISAMVEFNITNQMRAAAFLATIAVESMQFRYFEEIASGAAYEGRRDLGNIYPGDGRKYKGRGVIQVTGRANSEACLKFLGLPAGHPELLAEMSNAFRSAGWFWDPYKNLNPLADQGLFLKTQLRVNGRNRKTGKPNGWADRLAFYERALRILPEDLRVTDDGIGRLVADSVTNDPREDDDDDDIPEARPLHQEDDDDGDDVAETAERVPATSGVGVRVGAGNGVGVGVGAATIAATSMSAGAGVPGNSASAGPDLTPVENGGPNDAPVIVEAAAPAKERSTKSLVSTLTAGLGSVGLTIGALATRVADWIHNNPALVILFALAIIAVVVTYLLFQHRQTKLDLADREHARDITLETMRIRSDPRLINVQVVPRAVPPESGKG